jgi:hypothetical protein
MTVAYAARIPKVTDRDTVAKRIEALIKLLKVDSL